MTPRVHPFQLASILAAAVVLAATAVAAGCAATPHGDSTGEYIDDAGTTAKVKAALLRDDSVKSFDIKVETVKGVVQLSGFVDSSAVERAAEHDAYTVKGVTQVIDSLVLK